MKKNGAHLLGVLVGLVLVFGGGQAALAAPAGVWSAGITLPGGGGHLSLEQFSPQNLRPNLESILQNLLGGQSRVSARDVVAPPPPQVPSPSGEPAAPDVVEEDGTDETNEETDVSSGAGDEESGTDGSETGTDDTPPVSETAPEETNEEQENTTPDPAPDATSGSGSPPVQEPRGGGTGPGMVSIVFDDNHHSAYTLALPIVEAAGFRTTHYLVSGRIGFPEFLSSEEIIDVARRHEIGAHTVTHTNLGTLSLEDMRRELVEAKRILEELIGRSVNSFTYPFGATNAEVREEVIKAGYTSARGTEGGINQPGVDRYNLRATSLRNFMTFEDIKERIDSARAADGWFIMAIHDVGTGRAYSIEPELMRQIVEYLEETGVRVVTVSEGVAALGL